ncbi:MAG: hypothetical protein F4Y57_13650, partial [Acidobacteria bacterium]|nr:hypothetical protein [Acidobacteriota bacterium]
MPTKEKWNEYLKNVRRYVATGKLDKDEINYKLEIGRKLEHARRAFLAGDTKWPDLLKRALSGRYHPIAWRDADYFRKWLSRDQEAAREALRTIWTHANLRPGDIRAFSKQFPPDTGPGGAGTRLRTISVLLMALGPNRYPPYMVTASGKSLEKLSYADAPAGADEETLYGHAMAFLDELVSRAKEQRLERPANRLEAQSIVWV